MQNINCPGRVSIEYRDVDVIEYRDVDVIEYRDVDVIEYRDVDVYKCATFNTCILYIEVHLIMLH